MVIAILGGTGEEGTGLALRWARSGHRIIIGSRRRERAESKAREMNTIIGQPLASGATNLEAATDGEVVVLALSYAGLAGTLPQMREACRGKIVVSAVVPLAFGGPRLFSPPPIGSAAEEAQALLGAEAKVVAAFHHIAAHELGLSDHPLDSDLLICGADRAAKEIVAGLGREMGLRPLDAGPLENAGALEGITAILATLNRLYKVKGAGIRITGLPDRRTEAND
jgi:NADPH-dependent F420 reductase